MEIKEVLANIQGVDERFATLILKFIDNYINMSSDKTTVANNLLQQIAKNVKAISFKSLDGISGSVSKTGSTIVLDDNLEDWVLDNTFLHEFVHQISRNAFSNGENLIQPNCGLKVGIDEQMEFSAGVRLRKWETDGNNYAYDKGIETFDEWITEWLANKMSGLINAELKVDDKGFFRKKTSHGYDGSNIMNLLELVYGSENIANLITGFDLSEEERKCVIPIKEIHKLNEMIDSSKVLSQDEIEIFKNLQPPYMKTPNITGLLTYYISEYQKQDKLEDYNVYLQKMLDVLVRSYSVSFNNKIVNCGNYSELEKIYQELSSIQNSMIWNEDPNIMNSLESYRIFDKMRNDFSLKSTQLNIQDDKFMSLYLSPAQMLEKFKQEEEEVRRLHNPNKESTPKM